jgi:hypothetical protein
LSGGACAGENFSVGSGTNVLVCPPASVPPTDAERVYLHKTSAFGGGTYKVNGDKVTLVYTASGNQPWTGMERTMTVQVSDKVLTWISGTPFKAAEGKDAVATITFERLE